MAEGYTGRTLREIVRVVANRMIGMILIVAAVVAAAAAATYYAPWWYRSEVQLRANPARNANPLETQTPVREKVSLFVVTQRQIVMSDYVVASALRKLGGGQMPASTDDPRMKAWDAEVRRYIQENGEYIRRIKRRIGVVTPGGPDATLTQTFTIYVDWPEERDDQSRATARRLGKTARELGALRAREMAQCVHDAYILRYSQLEGDRIRNAAEMLEKQSLVVADTAIKDAVKDLNDYVAKELKGDLLQVIHLSGRRAPGAEVGTAILLTQFRAEINSIDARLAEIAALQAAIAVELKKTDIDDIVVPDVVSAANEVVLAIEAKIIETKLLINSLEPRFTADYRELKDAKEELAGVQKVLQNELKKQAKRLDQETAVQKGRRTAMAKIVADDNAKVEAMAAKAAEYDRLKSNMENAQVLYDEEKKRVLNAMTAERLAANPVLVSAIDEPSYPAADAPRRPIAWLNMLFSAVGGVLLALVYAFMADHFDHSIKSIDDAERYLGAPVLASIPKLGRGIIRRTYGSS